MKDFETIIFKNDNGIGTVIFNRPKVFNAYSETMSQELKEVFSIIEKDLSIRVVVLKGNGENFMAGADIHMLNDWLKRAEKEGWIGIKEMLKKHFSPTILETLQQPVIAAIDGMAWGMGSEIALACDFRICTHRASFSQPEITLGIIPGAGASQRLPRIVGKAKAMELIITGNSVNAEDAYRWGLVNSIVSPENLDATVAAFAGKITAKSPLMVKWAKQCVNQVLDHDLLRGIEKELTQFSQTFVTQDSKEGIAAFLEKRKPTFTGK